MYSKISARRAKINYKSDYTVANVKCNLCGLINNVELEDDEIESNFCTFCSFGAGGENTMPEIPVGGWPCCDGDPNLKPTEEDIRDILKDSVKRTTWEYGNKNGFLRLNAMQINFRHGDTIYTFGEKISWSGGKYGSAGDILGCTMAYNPRTDEVGLIDHMWLYGLPVRN